MTPNSRLKSTMSVQLNVDERNAGTDNNTLFTSDLIYSSQTNVPYWSTNLINNECSLNDGESFSLHNPESSTFPTGLDVANQETAFQGNHMPTAGLLLSLVESHNLGLDNTLHIKQVKNKEATSAKRNGSSSTNSFIGDVAQNEISSILSPEQSLLNLSTSNSPLKCSACTKVFVYKENFTKHVAKCGKLIEKPPKKKRKASKNASTVESGPRDSRSVSKSQQWCDQSTTSNNTNYGLSCRWCRQCFSDAEQFPRHVIAHQMVNQLIQYVQLSLQLLTAPAPDPDSSPEPNRAVNDAARWFADHLSAQFLQPEWLHPAVTGLEPILGDQFVSDENNRQIEQSKVSQLDAAANESNRPFNPNSNDFVCTECGWRGDRGEPALRHLCHNHPLNLST